MSVDTHSQQSRYATQPVDGVTAPSRLWKQHYRTEDTRKESAEWSQFFGFSVIWPNVKNYSPLKWNYAKKCQLANANIVSLAHPAPDNSVSNADTVSLLLETLKSIWINRWHSSIINKVPNN